jgi:two-component system chemotaxis sensor kinase CheA
MTLRVPLTLTIIPALTVSIQGQHFAIPRSAIEEIVRVNGESVTLEHLGGAGVATIRGRRVPEVSLAEILGLGREDSAKDQTLIVLRPAGGDVYALSVERIHDHEELVVKPAAPAVMATGLYAGTTLADDGSPILLLDPAGLAEVGGVKLEAQERAARIAGSEANNNGPKSTPVLLFRGLDGGRRALRLALVDRIEEVPASAVRPAAGQLRVQVGEAILPLAGASTEDIGEAGIRLFRLNDGQHEMGYAFAEVLDFASIEHDVIHAERPGEVSGVTLINGEPAELIDAHWLFANHVGATARPVDQPVCRLPADDPWMQNMLRPIVEAAGYLVVADDEAEADLVIAPQGSEVAAEGAKRTIWLRTEPEAKNKKDESIYRYDRAGLLMALKAAGAGGAK